MLKHLSKSHAFPASLDLKTREIICHIKKKTTVESFVVMSHGLVVELNPKKVFLLFDFQLQG